MKKFIGSSFGIIYLSLAIVSLMITFFAAQLKWRDLVSDVRQDLASIHNAMLRSAVDRLFQQESMLKLLGYRILETDITNDPKRTKRVMDDLLEDNPAFIGYTLAHASGDVILQTMSPLSQVQPSIHISPLTSEPFRETLASRSLTVGPSFYVPNLGHWVIPLSYAIRDETGEALYVISAGIDLDGDHNPFSRRNTETDYSIFVTNASDTHGHYFPISYEPLTAFGKPKSEFYGSHLPQGFTDAIVARIEQVSGKSLEALVKGDFSISFISSSPGFSPAYSTIDFNKKHRFFFGMRKIVHTIKAEHRYYVSLYIGALCLFNALVFFVLYRMHSSAERFRLLLRRQARHDRLTDLPNRYFLEKSFEKWSENLNGNYSLLFMDLDNFKYINDHYGHATGDKVLVRTAEKIKQFCHGNTLVIRQSGDEFLILLPFKDPTKLAAFADQIVHAVSEPTVIDNINTALTISIGIASSTDEDESLATLMIKADIAMYQAKKFRNGHAFFSDSMQQANNERALLEAELHKALGKDEMFLVYQPQISATDGRVVGVEALLRWQNETLGFVPPDKFISIAENCGQISAIGEFVIDRAFCELKELLRQQSHMNLSINVSVQQLIDVNFRTRLHQRLEQYQLASSSITIEVTESVFIEDVGQIGNLLTLINNDGFRISLDDFGTGYASLSSLRILPFTEVKIDRSFVADMLSDKQDENLVEGIVNIGDSLQISVLAEGVEELEQAQRLKSFGCELFQGYYFAKPMRIEELNAFLSSYVPLEI